MREIKLRRSINSAREDATIDTIKIKDNEDFSAADFYEMKVSSDGTMKLGDMAGTAATIAGLTERQVADLHPKDFMELVSIAGKFLE